jgi:hypothetical protein
VGNERRPGLLERLSDNRPRHLVASLACERWLNEESVGRRGQPFSDCGRSGEQRDAAEGCVVAHLLRSSQGAQQLQPKEADVRGTEQRSSPNFLKCRLRSRAIAREYALVELSQHTT